MTTPCDNCPFRNDVKPYLYPERAQEIIHAITDGDGTFPCHKTTVEDECEEDGLKVTNDSQHCAGALIFLEKQNGGDGNPNQMMRISERLGLYDRRKLDMDAPVYEGVDDFLCAYEV